MGCKIRQIMANETIKQFRGYFAGTKAEFQISALKTQADADGLIIFIADTAGSGAGSCLYALGTYFADFKSLLAALAYLKGVRVSGTNYTAAAGGGYVELAASDPATVALNVTDGKVTIGLTAAFVKKVDDVVAQAAIIAKDYLTSTDKTSLENAINLAKQLAIQTVVGQSTDGKNDDTVYGAKAYAKVEITEASGSGEVAKVYTIKQGGTVIGTINTIKDLVIQSGEVTDKNGVKTLVLTLNNGNTIDIPVADLVDVYTAGANAAQIQLAISANNVITASIVAGSVGTTELAGSAVTTAKIAANAVTKEKLASAVQTSLNKADAAAPQSTTYTKAEVDAMFAWVEI